MSCVVVMPLATVLAVVVALLVVRAAHCPC